ncbi:hypothetical protein K8I31_09135, partial [bacterium]|nr:hypothetical protein [bacterium]
TCYWSDEPEDRDSYIYIENDESYGYYTEILSKQNKTAYVAFFAALDVDFPYIVTFSGTTGLTGKRWRKICEYNKDGGMPATSTPTSDISGSYWSQVSLGYPDLIQTNEAVAEVDYDVTAKVTGDTQHIDRKEAVRVKSNALGVSLSISSGGLGGGLNWTPSGTGSSGANIGSFPSAGASNVLNEETVFSEGYINLIRVKVTLRGTDESGYASGDISLAIGL